MDVICGSFIVVILGFGIAGNLKNPRSTAGLLSLSVEGERAYGNGYTDERSVGYVRRVLKDNPQIDTLVLQSMPGTQNANQNLRIARNIRKKGIKTHLEANSFIASGAVDLFIAGEKRTIECGAKIGVHSWSAGDLYDAQDSYFDDRRATHERFLRQMGIDESFYVFTREAAAADSLHILTDEEIRRFGLSTEPYDCSA